MTLRTLLIHLPEGWDGNDVKQLAQDVRRMLEEDYGDIAGTLIQATDEEGSIVYSADNLSERS